MKKFLLRFSIRGRAEEAKGIVWKGFMEELEREWHVLHPKKKRGPNGRGQGPSRMDKLKTGHWKEQSPSGRDECASAGVRGGGGGGWGKKPPKKGEVLGIVKTVGFS